MNIKSSLTALLASAALFVGTALIVQAADGNKPTAKKETAAASGKLMPVTDKDAAWAAQARKTYPLDVCVASDEKLGSMGKSPEYIYRVDGRPDRLVVFCCDGCEEDFMKEPAKYLSKLEAAQNATALPDAKKKNAP